MTPSATRLHFACFFEGLSRSLPLIAPPLFCLFLSAIFAPPASAGICNRNQSEVSDCVVHPETVVASLAALHLELTNASPRTTMLRCFSDDLGAMLVFGRFVIAPALIWRIADASLQSNSAGVLSTPKGTMRDCQQTPRRRMAASIFELLNGLLRGLSPQRAFRGGDQIRFVVQVYKAHVELPGANRQLISYLLQSLREPIGFAPQNQQPQKFPQ